MTCTNCGSTNTQGLIPPSPNRDYQHNVLGKNIIGRSKAGYDFRIRDTPMGDTGMDYPNAPSPTVKYNGTADYGYARSEAERKARHMALYGNSNLPPRGTGRVGTQRMDFDFHSLLGGVVIGFINRGLLLTSTGRKIGYRAGERIASRI